MDIQLRRIYLTAGLIFAGLTAGSLAWRDAKVTGGVACGVVVSMVPYVTWQIIVGGFTAPTLGRKVLVFGIVAVKYAVVCGALWLLLSTGAVSAMAATVGLVGGSLSVMGAAVGGAKR